jgi:hypothetical protein
MNSALHRDLRVLEAIAEDQAITQRRLAMRLGIALGLTNLYVHRLARKGYIKCISARSNRLRYLLTPKGAAEKMRLTYEFMQQSLLLYREVRRHLRDRLQPIVVGRSSLRVAICGTGEAAELAYLSLKELNVEPAAVLDWGPGGLFLGLPVLEICDHPLDDYDVIIAATLAEQDALVVQLTRRGVPPERIVRLRPPKVRRSRPARGRRKASGHGQLRDGWDHDEALTS